METKLTLVTGLFKLPSSHRSVDTYLELFDQLAEVKLPIIVVLDEQLSAYRTRLEQHHNVTVISKSFSELPSQKIMTVAAQHHDLALPATRNHGKDSFEYISLMHAKLDFVELATQLSTASHFAYIDFGTMHMVPPSQRVDFIDRLSELGQGELLSRCIFIPGCHPRATSESDLWKQIHWRFCGTFLLGDRASLLELQALHQRVLATEVSLRKAVTWEVNLWALLEIKYGQHFDWYAANHDASLINIPGYGRMTDDAIVSFVRPYTSVGEARTRNVLQLVENVITSNVPGDLVEIGVWKGGLIMAMALKCKQMGASRKIHVYDTFQGMTEPGQDDVDLNGHRASDIFEHVACRSAFDETKRNIDLARYPNIEYHVGDVRSVEAADIPEIALLRLDTDWYELTKFELDHFEPRVADGGFVVIDDYGHWRGCKKAVDEFLEKRPHAIIPIDYSGIWWRKSAPVSAATICLNMIVKNESAIIERCLASVADVIDDWVICDTGSTDDTVAKIEAFFHARGIPGSVVHTTFKDFAQARNEALEAARKRSTSDYLMLMDADMELQGQIDKSHLGAHAYRLTQKTGFLSYDNTRLVRRRLGAKYIGVTHEYLNVPGPEPQRLDSAWFWDHAAGANRTNKAERDIKLLLEGLVAEPGNGRYMFYLAQTYREIGKYDEAIAFYLARIAVRGWDEELWYSHYAIGLCYLSKQEQVEKSDYQDKFISACWSAYNLRPTRAEPLYCLAKWYRMRGINEAAMAICEVGIKIEKPSDMLFVEDAIYDHGFAEEMSIVGFHCRDPRRNAAGYEHCAALTMHQSDGTREMARRNFVHYVKSAEQLFDPRDSDIRFAEIGPLKTDLGYAPMNPSIYCGPEGRWGIVRTVNYKVAAGQYPTSDGSGIIKTKNIVVRFDEEWMVAESWPIVDDTTWAKTKYPVEGFEDVRLFRWADRWWGSTTVRDREGSDGRCEIAIIEFEQRADTWHVVDMRIIRDIERDQHQKNWMPFIGGGADLMFVYKTDPTTIIDLAKPTTEIVARASVPGHNLQALRGGSQAIPIRWPDDNWKRWLYIAHEVVMVDNHRVYLHRFVLLDENLSVLAVTDPFYFKQKGIEFAAGIALDDDGSDMLVVSFGVNDASAHLMFINKDAVLEHLRPVKPWPTTHMTDPVIEPMKPEASGAGGDRIVLLVLASEATGSAHECVKSAMELAAKYDSVDALVAVNESMAREARRLFGEDADKVVRIVKHLGCPVKTLAELVVGDRLAEKADIIGVVSDTYRFTKVNWDEVVRAKIDDERRQNASGAMFVRWSKLEAMRDHLIYLHGCHDHDGCSMSPTEVAAAVGAVSSI